MKQTAVEWLFQELERMENMFDKNSYEYQTVITQTLEQAKEMEKQQIIDAHLDGQNFSVAIEEIDYAKQYYNETFNK